MHQPHHERFKWSLFIIFCLVISAISLFIILNNYSLSSDKKTTVRFPLTPQAKATFPLDEEIEKQKRNIVDENGNYSLSIPKDLGYGKYAQDGYIGLYVGKIVSPGLIGLGPKPADITSNEESIPKGFSITTLTYADETFAEEAAQKARTRESVDSETTLSGEVLTIQKGSTPWYFYTLIHPIRETTVYFVTTTSGFVRIDTVVRGNAQDQIAYKKEVDDILNTFTVRTTTYEPLDVSDWLSYANAAFGFSFEFPASWRTKILGANTGDADALPTARYLDVMQIVSQAAYPERVITINIFGVEPQYSEEWKSEEKVIDGISVKRREKIVTGKLNSVIYVIPLKDGNYLDILYRHKPDEDTKVFDAIMGTMNVEK